MTLTLSASLLLAAVGGATPTSSPVVVRVTTELVQVDAVVLDKKGQHVTDLTAADFEITERGRKQTITHCQYVLVESSPSAEGRPADGVAAAWSPPKREEIKRIVVMMVDDLGLSVDGINLTKEALAEHVDKRMGTADLVAVVRTGGSGGVLQQLTNDGALLRASVAQLRYNGLAVQAKSPREIVAERRGHPSEITVEYQRKSALALRTIRAIQSTARGMEGLPGRKSIVVFSNTLLLKAAPVLIDGAASQALEMDAGMVEAMHELAQTASRASVVIHSVDPRGHGAAFLTHRAEYEGPGPRDMRLVRKETLDDHAGLGHMADETGGTFQGYINDARGAVERVMHQLRGYYLIGYTPETSSDPKARDGGRYHQLSVRVTRPGLKVRSRKGYYGTTEEERELAQASTTIAAAAGSPFASTDLRVSVTALFGHDGSGSSVRTIVHVDAANITFAAQPDGTAQADIETLAFALGDGGVEGEVAAREVKLPLSAEEAERLKRTGLELELSLPVKKPGPYQIRAVVKDTPSKKMGTATRFLMVPDLRQARLAASGIALSKRRVRPGAAITYGFVAFQPKLDRDAARLTVQVRLSRDGQVVSASEPGPPESIQRLDGQAEGVVAFACGGTVTVPATASPGTYALEVTLTDTLAKKEHATVTDAAELQVVP